MTDPAKATPAKRQRVGHLEVFALSLLRCKCVDSSLSLQIKRSTFPGQYDGFGRWLGVVEYWDELPKASVSFTARFVVFAPGDRIPGQAQTHPSSRRFLRVSFAR
jgi:hypothetical protein